MMSVVFLFLFVLSCVVMKISALHLINLPPIDCSQQGVVCKVQVDNCSEQHWVVPRYEAPAFPLLVPAKVSVKRDDSGQYVPVLNITWMQISDSSIFSLKGAEVHVVEMATNHSICIQYIFQNRLLDSRNPDDELWSFSLDRIVVIPQFTYQVIVANLPKPDVGINYANYTITVPENIWDAKAKLSVRNTNGNDLVIIIRFKPDKLFDQYKVSICSQDLQPEPSLNVTKGNKHFLEVNVTLETWRITNCNVDLVVQPLNVKSMKNFLDYRKKVDICPFLPGAPVVYIVMVVLGMLLGILAAVGCCLVFLKNKDSLKDTPYSCSSKYELEWNPFQERKKLIIIYSLDHPLYKEIILKLCAFLRAKCGIDVTLDLFDSSWLSTIGRIQWLDTQRERISKSSDKVLILCSPGVRAKWNAMCGQSKVRLKEDESSPIGDMLTPALSLIMPDFLHASSFHKYMVAHFDDVCSEDDVPAPFNVVVKYKLMKHFEELFFRILDMEKHEPGHIKCIEGISENDYFSCSSGLALRNAIETFHRYQLKNPNWFEMELLDTDDEEEDTGFESDVGYNPIIKYSQLNEEHKAHVSVNLIKYQNDEHDLKSAMAESGLLLNENSSVYTTNVYCSSPVESRFTAIDVKGLPATLHISSYCNINI